MQIPTAPEDIAAAMDPWEAVNGGADLYDQLTAHLGESLAGALWSEACHIYDATHLHA